MSRWNKDKEIRVIKDSIRELVLSSSPRFGNKGVLVPLRTPVSTGEYYPPNIPVKITGVYVDYDKPEVDRMVANDFYWDQYDGTAATVKYGQKVLDQLSQMKAANGMVQASVSEKLKDTPPKLVVFLTNGYTPVFIDDKTASMLDRRYEETALKDRAVYNNVYNDEGRMDFVNTKGLGPYHFENILKTARELGNRNIVLPLDNGRAHILFDGDRTNIPNPEVGICLYKNGGIEAMEMIAKHVDKDSTVSYPDDGHVARHPVDVTFSSKDAAETFLDEYIHRHTTVKNVVITRTVSTQTVFDDYQSMHVNAYLLENGGTVADTREKAARTLMKSCEADMSDTVEPGWKENTLNELLAMARGEGRSKGLSR